MLTNEGMGTFGSADELTGGFDIIRFVAAFAMVGYHSLCFSAYLPTAIGLHAQVLQGWLYAALPIFFILSGLLEEMRGPATAWPGKRINRLLFLYVTWSLLYLAYHVVTGTTSGAFAAGPLGLFFLGLASDHLWFLLVLTECIALTWACRRLGIPYGVGIAGSAAGAAAFIIANSAGLLGPTLVLVLYRTPLPWWGFYLLGVGMGRHRAALSSIRRPHLLLPLLLPAAALGIIYRLPHPGQYGYAALMASISAIALIAILFVMTTRIDRGRTRHLAGLTLGMYLIHPVVVSVVEVPWKRLGLNTPPMVRGLVVWLAAAMVCVVVVRILHTTRLRAVVH